MCIRDRYYYLRVLKNRDVAIVGLDLKKDVIEFCNKTAQELGCLLYTSFSAFIQNISGVTDARFCDLAPVSYTHLDVYKRQVLKDDVIDPYADQVSFKLFQGIGSHKL